MFGYQHICEIPDLAAKIELIFQARSIADFDVASIAKKMGMRVDHFNEMLEQTKFRHSTLIKLSDVLRLPTGIWFWEWAEIRNYLEVK